jgi:hypothetical protein
MTSSKNIRTPERFSLFPTVAEPNDSIMMDADSGYTSDDDSPEMKTLKKGQRPQPTLDTDRGMLNIPSGPLSEAAESIMQNDFTVFPSKHNNQSHLLTIHLDHRLRRTTAAERPRTVRITH